MDRALLLPARRDSRGVEMHHHANLLTRTDDLWESKRPGPTWPGVSQLATGEGWRLGCCVGLRFANPTYWVYWVVRST